MDVPDLGHAGKLRTAVTLPDSALSLLALSSELLAREGDASRGQ